jgi:hypothetical protein
MHAAGSVTLPAGGRLTGVLPRQVAEAKAGNFKRLRGLFLQRRLSSAPAALADPQFEALAGKQVEQPWLASSWRHG